MKRLTVISDTTDRELAAIRLTVREFATAGDEPSFVQLLRDKAEAAHQIDTLDLVGHSGRHGFLRIGSWILDDSAQTAGSFDAFLRPVLSRLGVRTIRLLGCSTARSERGWKAMAQIGRAARCRVLGTRRYIGRSDYRGDGYISDEVLAGAPGPHCSSRTSGSATQRNPSSKDVY